MMFKLHQALLAQIAASVNAFGECYVHGDGNIYAKDEKTGHAASDFRKDFANPKQEDSTYRVKYTKGDKIPTTVKELEEALLASRNRERQEAATVKHASGIKTIKVEEPAASPKAPEKTQAQLDEEELQRQIDEEAKNKNGAGQKQP